MDDKQVYRSVQFRDPGDDELAAISLILVALRDLEKDKKQRVLKYVSERLDDDIWKKLD